MILKGFLVSVVVLVLVGLTLTLGQQALTQYKIGQFDHIEAVTWSNGPSLVTHGSLSTLGRVGIHQNPTVGKLKDSYSGPDTKNCVNDGTKNGVKDRQTVWEHGYPGHPNAWFIADEVKDRNGTKRGGNCHVLRDPKEKHQVSSLSGGTTSKHLRH